MADVRETLKYLKSLWGALASITVLFPTASSFIKIPMISDSVLKALYAATGTTLAALTLLIVLAFRDSLDNASRSRKLAVGFLVVASALLFTFVGLKTSVLYDHQTTAQTFEKNVDVLTKRSTRADGQVSVLTRREDSITHKFNEDMYVQTSPYEVLALAVFSTMLVCFTASFSVIGIYHYNVSHRSPKNQRTPIAEA